MDEVIRVTVDGFIKKAKIIGATGTISFVEKGKLSKKLRTATKLAGFRVKYDKTINYSTLSW